MSTEGMYMFSDISETKTYNYQSLFSGLFKDFLDRIGHALNIYHTQYYTDELTDTIFFVTQQKYAGVNTSSNSIYYLFMTFRVLASKQSKQARDDPIAMFLLR